MYLRALQRKACLLPEVSPFLFQTTTGLMWSSLCTGGILAGKAAKAVNFLQTAEEALVLSNVGDAVLEQWSDKTFYHAAVRTTRVRMLYRYMYERNKNRDKRHWKLELSMFSLLSHFGPQFACVFARVRELLWTPTCYNKSRDRVSKNGMSKNNLHKIIRNMAAYKLRHP